MSSNKLRQDATASTKGAIYQLCVAVQKCYEMIAGQKVFVENLGDVTIEDQEQVETKYYRDSLTDNHSNFWNTLHNWVKDGFDSSPYTSLILYTTQQFGEKATISEWNNSDLEGRFEILSKIHKKSEERNSERRKKGGGKKSKTPISLLHQRFVLDGSRQEKLRDVISKFFIEACSPELPELHTIIKQQYIKGILNGKKDDFLNALIGFITQPQSGRGQHWEISYEAFDRKVGDLHNLYRRETRVFPRKHLDSIEPPGPQQVKEHRNHTFIQKITDIEYSEVIPDAISDYVAAVKTVRDEFKNYEVPVSRTENYTNELVRIYNTRYRIACRSCRDVISDSKNHYDHFTSEEPRKFEGFERPPDAFRNGLLHTQMDDDEKELQWRLEKR